MPDYKHMRLSAEEVIDYCRKNLAGFKKPRLVRFVEAMPRTSIGKIAKKRSARTLLEGALAQDLGLKGWVRFFRNRTPKSETPITSYTTGIGAGIRVC